MPPSSGESTEPDFSASPRININHEFALKEGISITVISDRVQAFFKAHDQFTLDELKELGITTSDGRTVKLSQVASIEVVFRKETPKIPAEQAAPYNGDKPSN